MSTTKLVALSGLILAALVIICATILAATGHDIPAGLWTLGGLGAGGSAALVTDNNSQGKD